MNGIECFNNQTSSCLFATIMVCWMGLKCYINKMLHNMNIFLLVWLTGMKICLTRHVTMISLADECLMEVAFILGFALGFTL